ncbi:hypothetical protein ACJX0J_017267, partial [Zea mays]
DLKEDEALTIAFDAQGKRRLNRVFDAIRFFKEKKDEEEINKPKKLEVVILERKLLRSETFVISTRKAGCDHLKSIMRPNQSYWAKEKIMRERVLLIISFVALVLILWFRDLKEDEALTIAFDAQGKRRLNRVFDAIRFFKEKKDEEEINKVLIQDELEVVILERKLLRSEIMRERLLLIISFVALVL